MHAGRQPKAAKMIKMRHPPLAALVMGTLASRESDGGWAAWEGGGSDGACGKPDRARAHSGGGLVGCGGIAFSVVSR